MLHWFKGESKFSALFILSVLSIMVPSFFSQTEIFEFVFLGMFSILVIAATITIRYSQKHSKWVSVWAFATLFVSWLFSIDAIPVPMRIGNVAFLLFFFYIVWFLIRSILQSKDVKPDVIFGAISGYIFLGYTGAIYFIVVHHIYPHSFSGDLGDSMNAVYFSFVTMTTLGYGDVLPLTNAAKGGVIILTILGQFYIAVIVALLVSKYIAQRKN